MNTENTVIYQCSERQVIEHFRAVTPHIHRAIFAQTFIIKSINLSNLTAFVVSADQSDSVRIADLSRRRKEKKIRMKKKINGMPGGQRRGIPTLRANKSRNVSTL